MSELSFNTKMINYISQYGITLHFFNYYNYYTTKKWGQLKNFDLTINSDFGIEEVADIIVALYQKEEHRQK